MQAATPANAWQSGHLFFRPIMATLERNTRTTGQMCPYIIFKTPDGTQQKLKPCVNGGTAPHWDEQVELKGSRGQMIVVELWDQVPNGKDVQICSVGINFEAIIDSGFPYQKKIGLYHNHKVIGNLLFAADFISPVKIDLPLSDNPYDRHKRHMQYAPYFKTGTLYLRPIQAFLTRDTDLILKMTPRVIFKYEDKQVKTNVCHAGGKEPKWDEEVELTVSRGGKIKVEVWNCHTIGKDEIIASGEITVNNILDSTSHYQISTCLSHDGKDAGKVLIAASLVKGVVVKYLPSTPEGRHENHKQVAANWQSGKVYIRPFGAWLTHDTAMLSMSPYIVFKFGDKQLKSTTANGKNPQWNEEFELTVSRNDIVTIEVWDHHTVGDDKLVGIHRLPVNDVVDSKNHYQWAHELVFEGKKAGKLAFAASLISPVMIKVDEQQQEAHRRHMMHMMHMMGHMNHMNHMHH